MPPPVAQLCKVPSNIQHGLQEHHQNTLTPEVTKFSIRFKISVFHELFLDCLCSTKSQYLEIPPYTLCHTHRTDTCWYLRALTSSGITFDIQHVELTWNRHPGTTLDDQEGFKRTIYLRSWTKEPPNPCLVLESLCSSTDTYPSLAATLPSEQSGQTPFLFSAGCAVLLQDSMAL